MERRLTAPWILTAVSGTITVIKPTRRECTTLEQAHPLVMVWHGLHATGMDTPQECIFWNLREIYSSCYSTACRRWRSKTPHLEYCHLFVFVIRICMHSRAFFSSQFSISNYSFDNFHTWILIGLGENPVSRYQLDINSKYRIHFVSCARCIRFFVHIFKF